MIEIRKYKAEDAIGLMKDPNEFGLVCYPDVVKEERAKLYETAGPAYTGTLNGKVVGCGGICTLWEGVGEAWVILPKGTGKELFGHRIVKRKLMEMTKEGNYHRVQVTPRADWPIGIEYAKWLGFECDGLMPGYRSDGVDCIMYSIVRKGK